MPLLAVYFEDPAGTPAGGLSPTISILDGDDPTGALIQTAAAMVEATSLAGLYVYNFNAAAGWTSALRWVARVDGGAALGSSRYQPVSEVAASNESGESALVNADGLQADAVTEVQSSILSDATPLDGAALNATPDKVTEVHQIHGLELGTPAVITSTDRDAGAGVSQTIVESPPGTVTVTRDP